MKKLTHFVGILAFAFLFSQCEKEKFGYEIGDLHDLGIVFYVDESRELGLVCQTEDFDGVYNWDDATEACKDLGDGWRLPTKEELNLMYENLHKEGLGGFAASVYWSSTEIDDNDVWRHNFANGFQIHGSKTILIRVRAVRAF